MRSFVSERSHGLRLRNRRGAIGDHGQCMVVSRAFRDPDRFDSFQLTQRSRDRFLATRAFNPSHASPIGDVSGEGASCEE